MATITVDSQSLSLNGRRLWLVSGTIHWSRLPKELWRDRLRRAKLAGLNTVELPVAWSSHEPRRGRYDFEGDLDLDHMLRLVHDVGLHAIVRIGPYIGDGYDLGGVPSWLAAEAEGALRSGKPEFLQACSRYISEAASRVVAHQATASNTPTGAPGPVLLVQCEHEWFSGDDDAAAAYLGELVRYLREAGVRVPIANRDNLFHTVEGMIDAWSGAADLHATVRQLAAVRPMQPRLVLGLPVGAPDVWGRPPRSKRSPDDVLRMLCEVLAAGGQFNMSPFVGGTALGFSGGRLDLDPGAFVTTNRDEGGPIAEGGAPGDALPAVRRVCTFASSFARVFAGLDPTHHPVAAAPDATVGELLDPDTGERAPRKRGVGANLSVVHAAGSAGDVVFLFSDNAAAPRTGARTTLTLPDGSSLPVELGDLPVMWLLTGVHLKGMARLDYANLSPLTLLGSTLVLFGPAGAPGVVSISGSAFEVTVPKGKKPVVEDHEGVTVVVCSTEQADAAVVSNNTVYIGADDVSEDGAPVAAQGFAQVTVVDSEGTVSATAAPKTARRPTKPAIGDWERAHLDDYIDGETARFARINGPGSMESLGSPDGYGWLRLAFRAGAAKKTKALLPQAADRIALYHQGALTEIAGVAPGAAPGPVTLPIKKGDNTITALIDNLGRYAEGNLLGEKKGLFGHVYEVAPVKAPAPTLEHGPSIGPADFGSAVYGLPHGERTDAQRLTWNVVHRKKSPLIVRVAPADIEEDVIVLLVNGEPAAVVSPRGCASVVLDSERLNRGSNSIQLTVPGDTEAAAPKLKVALDVFEGLKCLSGNAEWSFAKWETPPAERWEPATKAAVGNRAAAAVKGRPCWWRTRFRTPGVELGRTPLFLDAAGLSKGVLFINGKNAGRYFVQTHTGEDVPPQNRYYLPEPYLEADGDNELMIFDEHGFGPGKAALLWG